MTTVWTTSYPTALDTFSPSLIDYVDEVLSAHVNIPAQAIIALETRLGITNGVANGFGGVAFDPLGQAACPSALGIPTVWINNTLTPEHLIFTDSAGTNFDLVLSGGSLDYAYDFGGAGVGKSITADTGAVTVTVPNLSANSGLELVQNNVGYFIPSLYLSGATKLIYALDKMQIQTASSATGSDFNIKSSTFGGAMDSAMSFISSVQTGGTGSADALFRSYVTGIGNATLGVTCGANSGTGTISISATSTSSTASVDLSATTDITFNANTSGTIPFNVAAPNNVLVGFTATSIVGALNELKVGITVADEATDTTCFPLFVTAATGELAPKTNSGLTFNSSTSALASTLFSANTITANLAFVPDLNDGATLGTTALQFSDLFLALGAVINFDNGASLITHSANTLTIGGSGATTLALGTNSLTMTGSIGATGARVTKGWFADLESSAGIVLGVDVAGGSPNTAGYLKLFSAGDNAFYTTFTAGTQTANATYTLPTAPPTVDGMALVSTTAGVTSWSTIISGGDSEDGMTVYKNIYNDFSVVYKDADEIELVGLPFNITAVQIKKITRKPTGSAVSVVKNRGTDLVCIWTPDVTIQGKGSITTTSLGTFASTDEYIVEVEGEPKGYAVSTDAVKSYVVNDIVAINDGLIASVSSDDAAITKALLIDGFNAISLNVNLGAVGDFVQVYGTNDPVGSTPYHDITALACGVPRIITSGAYQTSGVIMFPYIKIVIDGNTSSAEVYLTRFLKK